VTGTLPGIHPTDTRTRPPTGARARRRAAGFDWSATYDVLVVACVHAADLAALTLRARLARRASDAQACPAGSGGGGGGGGGGGAGSGLGPGAALWEDVLGAWAAFRRWAARVVAASERLAECVPPARPYPNPPVLACAGGQLARCGSPAGCQRGCCWPLGRCMGICRQHALLRSGLPRVKARSPRRCVSAERTAEMMARGAVATPSLGDAAKAAFRGQARIAFAKRLQQFTVWHGRSQQRAAMQSIAGQSLCGCGTCRRARHACWPHAR